MAMSVFNPCGWLAVCGDGNLVVTVWDSLAAGSLCAVALGYLPSNSSNATLYPYPCSTTLYGKACNGMKDPLNLVFNRNDSSDASAPPLVQIDSHLAALGIAGLTQVASLGCI